MSKDLYGEWLMVPAGTRPPNYFDLLGLPLDVEDAGAIDQAARRQAKRVKEHQSEAPAGQCADLMQEIARARAVLLDPAKRTAYRASLAGKPVDAWWRSEAPAAAPQPASAPASQFLVDEAQESSDHFADLGTPRRRASGSKTGMIVV